MLTKEEVENIKLEDLQRVHMIGITSGISSFVATYLLNLGVKLTASEVNQDNHVAKDWIEKGVLYAGRHDSKYITEDIDLVVFPNGPIPGNPECEKAEKLGLSTVTMGQILGLVSKRFKTIAIAGTHGKTTTSALITWLLYKEFRELPNFVIGDEILEINKSFNFNPYSEYLVLEACEYKRQFLDRAPKPYISVITNIELDHTDYYKDQEDYNSAFREFLENTELEIIYDSRGENIEQVLKDIEIKKLDCKEIEAMYEDVTAGLFGDYNKENVLRACGVANILGIFADIEDFPGVASRFQYIGEMENGNPIYLDYAHNPKKVKSCLRAAKERFPNKKIVFIWQPHSIERSLTFENDFAKSLDDADLVLIPNIYAPLRERTLYQNKLSDKQFVKYLKEADPKKDIKYTKNFQNTAKELSKLGKDHVLVFASAGDLKDIFKLMDIRNE
ncbi:MAG: Mur ligase family protein [Candidatus Dojkabacteria bacterium]|nr:Mur ligase family protein [Candidatus Dojkabacteria bacterium]